MGQNVTVMYFPREASIMPVVEATLAIGYLTAWAVRKARRAGRRLDTIADETVDAGLDRLDGLVRSKLACHPALKDLDDEAAAVANNGPVDGESQVSELTRQQLELSLVAAASKDQDFARQLVSVLADLQTAESDHSQIGGITMTATASGHGRIYQAGRDQHIKEK